MPSSFDFLNLQLTSLVVTKRIKSCTKTNENFIFLINSFEGRKEMSSYGRKIVCFFQGFFFDTMKVRKFTPILENWQIMFYMIFMFIGQKMVF